MDRRSPLSTSSPEGTEGTRELRLLLPVLNRDFVKDWESRIICRVLYQGLFCTRTVKRT